MLKIEELLHVAKESALIAGKILLEGYGTSFKIMNKEGKNNLVTEYDFKAEKAIIENIKKYYPDHIFLAEESGKTGTNTETVRWIIDPLDGTVNFAHSMPIFSVSIAAEYQGEILCGVIYQPVLNELFYASKGNGAFMNDIKISVSENPDFESAFLVTGFPYNVNTNPHNCIDHFVSIIQRGIPIRRLGSAAVDMAYVACGRFDGFWEINLNPWDVAAGIIIVEEAGGKVTQYDLEKYKIFDDSILVTNGLIHNIISVDLMNSSCKRCNDD
jgi:myo-inositol-1(or 4)-monophosphatase